MTTTSQGIQVPDHANDSDVSVPQVSVVVANLEDGIRRYARLFEWRQWAIYDFRDLEHTASRVYGEPADYHIRVAITRAGGVDFELIEPIGPSPYQDYLDAHGPGFHHIQGVSPTVGMLERLAELGRPELCSGEFAVLGPGVFGYSIYDATPELPIIIGTYSGDASKLGDLPHRKVVVTADGAIEELDGRTPAAAPDALIQVAVVVEDIDPLLSTLRRTLGWGPWRVYDFRDVDLRNREYRGTPSDFAMRIATVRVGNLHIELLSPTGPGPYQDFLDEFGPGLHHIQVRGDSPTRAYDRLVANGATPQFSGRVGIDENSGLDFWLFEGASLPHLVEITVGDRARLMETVSFRLATGD